MKNIIVIYNDDRVVKRGNQSDLISLQSIVKTSEDVERILVESGFKTFRIGLNSNSLIDTIKKIRETKPYIIFNLCEAFDGNPFHEMNVAAIFELLDVAYTGSPPSVIGLTTDKLKTKQLLLQNNIPVPNGLQINNRYTYESGFLQPTMTGVSSIHCCEYADDPLLWISQNLKFPLIVKPLHEDGSIGIDMDSVVFRLETLKEKVEYLFKKYNQPAIAEEYINGREFNVSIIGNHSPCILPISEIDYSKVPHDSPKILCYTSKWIKDSDAYLLTLPRCPADVDTQLEKKIKEVALSSFRVTGCRDYGRVDIRLSEDGIPFVLEVNANPDISIDAGMAGSAIAAGWSYGDLVKKILNTAMERVL